MKTIRLAEHIEDGVLADPDDARFFAKRFGPEVCLDFDGVRSVTAAFLDVLLAGNTPESLADRIIGQTDAVDAELAAWIDRQVGGTGLVEKPAKRPPRPVAGTSKTPFTELGVSRPEGERYTPTRLANRLRHQLTSYIESAYPLSDSILVRARRKLLKEAGNGHLLAQEPFIETTPRYRTYDGDYRSLGLPAHIAELFAKLSAAPAQYSQPGDKKTILFPAMWTHQAEAYREFLVSGKDVIVATGTGSGKTECFLVPLLGLLYDEASQRPQSFAKRGVRALILYPMNALVNDQLSRLRRLFGDISVAKELREAATSGRHAVFGMYTGRTPYPGPRSASRDTERVRPLLELYTSMDPTLRNELQRLGRYPAKDIERFYAKSLEEQKTYATGTKTGREYKRYHWDQRLHTQPGDRELLTRQEMVKGAGTQPGDVSDILVTNYSMLEYMLMRPFERPIFQQTASWLCEEGSQFLLILDEAHMYRGARGAEVGFLIRRLCARLGITDRPDKLRVICTSASLGQDPGAMEGMRAFAADLTGKPPSVFASIRGERTVPSSAAPADENLGDMLAALDLDDLHAAAPPGRLRSAVTPLLAHLGVICPDDASDQIVLRELHRALQSQPFVNLVLKETASGAKSLAHLAEAVFPGHPRQRKAISVLVALATIAREQADEPGLVPTRIHALFRGLNGLHVCLNTACPERQDAPGERAVLGKLFTDPRSNCDACGSRVLELSSCRNCGSPYVIAYCPPSDLQNADFLWGETEGELEKIQLLPVPPRYADQTEEIIVHLKTGYIEEAAEQADSETRPFWICTDDKHERQPEFIRCAMCQPPSSRTRSRITDFRTKGEQPFTALIDAQFAEQPPQSADPRLPNEGRKVLVFSDGRQKAARLAPALEHTHARDVFRQVLTIAAHELVRQNQPRGMHCLYPAVLWVSKEHGLNPFPTPDETIFPEHLRRARGKFLVQLIQDFGQGFLTPTQSYARQLFSEVTDRYFSLSALALATIEEDGPVAEHIFVGFPTVGMEPEEIRALYRAWLRIQLEARRFLPQGADISALTDGWERPDGMDIAKLGDVVPAAIVAYLDRLLGDASKVNAVATWFQLQVRNSGLFRLENNLYFLQPLGLSLVLRQEQGWLRCRDCGRLHAQVVRDLCPWCLGPVELADVDYLKARTGYYRDQIRRAFDDSSLEPFGLVTAEHSAQLTGKDDQEAFTKTEMYELRFQDLPIGPPIDVLSCTTTMEVGIDIGTLAGVALRNVPPQVANYQQRAGRAGRRGRSVASVITYAHGTSHDAHYYANPHLIISGEVQPPIVYIENQQILRRHLNAYLVQRFFHETVQIGSDTFRLFESLGTVEQFLSGEFPSSLNKLQSWLQSNRSQMLAELRGWVPRRSYGLGADISAKVSETVDSAIEELSFSLNRVLPIEEFSHREQLDGLHRDSLERRLEENLLETLIDHAVLPRYAFPTDVVAFWVTKRKRPGDPPYKRSFDYEPQRDLQIALSEYAPGASLTIDKFRFESAGIFSPYEPSIGALLANARAYVACKCGYVNCEESAGSLLMCPCCSSDELQRSRFFTPPGFTPDINEKRELDTGEAATKAGKTTRAQIEVQEPPSEWDDSLYDGRVSVLARQQNLVMVNKGVGDRGFMVCSDCGRTEPVFGPGFTDTKLLKAGRPLSHRHPIEFGVDCGTRASGPYFLGHRFPTDVLLLQLTFDSPVVCATTDSAVSGRAGRVALTSLVEAICLASSRRLQIDEGELSGNWSPLLGGGDKTVYLFLYDLLPGGAGYTRLVKQCLDDVLGKAEEILSDCTCESSCYKCLRHYGNNILHASLDRGLALGALRFLRSGLEPSLSAREIESAVALLEELCRLKLKGGRTERFARRAGVDVPLVIVRPDASEVWVDVRHPLVDPMVALSAVRAAAMSEMQEFVSLDSFTLRHDLPSAVARLQL